MLGISCEFLSFERVLPLFIYFHFVIFIQIGDGGQIVFPLYLLRGEFWFGEWGVRIFLAVESMEEVDFGYPARHV